MIILAQLSWLWRVTAHKQLISYIKGFANTFPLTPAMIKERAKLRPYWRDSGGQLWRRILQSESLVRKEFDSGPAEQVSLFLKWYFRIF